MFHRKRWRVALADQAHSSLVSTLRIMDVDPLVVPTGPDDRLTGAALRAALDADPDASAVCAVVATAGTTNTGTIDELTAVADVAHERDVWVHVDGAYGLAGLAAPSVRDRFRGIERVDSFVVDPHKWLYAPFDCAALIYRYPQLAKAVHTQDASYLDVLHTDAPDEWNPSDYAFHLTRRARGLPLWFSLAVNGTDAYRNAIEVVLELARTTAARIEGIPHLELIRQPELSVVVFRRRGWTAEDYQNWSTKLLADQVAFVAPTKWEDETVARLAFLHPDTTMDIVEEILVSME